MSQLFIFRDLRKRFNVDPGDVMVYDLDALRESLDNIFTTRVGERFFNRGFGNTLGHLFYAPVNNITARTFLAVLITLLKQFEPRVTLDISSSQIIPLPNDRAFQVRLILVAATGRIIGAYETTIHASGR